MARSDSFRLHAKRFAATNRGPSVPVNAMETAAKALRAAEHVCVFTGAGISAESGVPTFRDAQSGLWSKYNAHELATPEAFARSPNLVWSWYSIRAAAVRDARPNEGHLALTTLFAYVPHSTLITQNVDDLHARAGAEHPLALHGNITHARCSAGCGARIAFADAPTNVAPHCGNCTALMRPDVVWFGEMLDADLLENARAATLACDVFLSIGTSNVVEPAASLPWIAASHGATVIVVNKSMQGQRSGPSIVQLEGMAGAVLPKLVTMAFQGRKPRYGEDS
ncbi:MAG: NAD-dependent protein deacylase [Gemmatimonadaceae bacterium]